MEIQNTLHKTKLIVDLFLHMHAKYRVEIEDYYVGSGDSCYLHHYYFANFKAAQNFIRGYDKEFYKITLFAQHGLKGTTCNLFTGSWITVEEENNIAYIHDKYGFLDIVDFSGDGWYLRGKNLHNPDYVAITDDLEFLKKETWDRYIKSGGVLTFREVVNDLFKERYPNAAGHYKKNFLILYSRMLDQINQVTETKKY